MSVRFSEIIFVLGLNIGGGGGFTMIVGKLLRQPFLPTVENTGVENEPAHLQHPAVRFCYSLVPWIKSSLLSYYQI